MKYFLFILLIPFVATFYWGYNVGVKEANSRVIANGCAHYVADQQTGNLNLVITCIKAK